MAPCGRSSGMATGSTWGPVHEGAHHAHRRSGPSFAANGVARIDATTGLRDPTWTPDVSWGGYVTTTKPIVWALAAAGGKIWIGGDFGAVDGPPRTKFAAVDAATGVVDPGVTAAVGTLGAQSVRAMVASSSTVYVGGSSPRETHEPPAAGRLRARRDARRDVEAEDGQARVQHGLGLCAVQHLRGWPVPTGGRRRRTWQPRETVARFDPASGALLPWAIPTGTIELDQKAYDLAPTCTQLNVGYGGRNYAAPPR